MGRRQVKTGCAVPAAVLALLVAMALAKLGTAWLVLIAVVVGFFTILAIGSKGRAPPPSEPRITTTRTGIEISFGEAAPAIAPSAPSGSSIGSDAAFFGPGVSVTVAGRTLNNPLTYIAKTQQNADASTIVTSLPVGRPRSAGPLGYWPVYSRATADQRALYLDWMAGGRRDTSVPIGYPFIFFYGLERRALVDRQDLALCRAEVVRLLGLYGYQRSFHNYATQFLAFLPALRWRDLGEAEVESTLLPLAADDDSALMAALAWHAEKARPLPAALAAHAASRMDDAKRGVVVKRSRAELLELFAIRYAERFGSGLRVSYGKSLRAMEYHPASGSLLALGGRARIDVPDVLSKRAQFRPVVELWNGCIDDLRKLTTKKAGAPDAMTREIWEALPPELRADVDHPDLDRWALAVGKAPWVGRAHLATAGVLATLAGLPRTEKLTAAQSKRLAETAAAVGFAVEPELRVSSRALAWDAPVAIWRTSETETPDPGLYVPASALLSLLLSIAIADGEADDRELELITTLIEDTLVLDDMMRQRMGALREVLLRVPAKANTIAKRLRETKTKEQLASVGRMLVAVAAADGVLADGEHKALKSVFRALGLSGDELDASLIAVGLRRELDAPVQLTEARRSPGERLPPPPGAGLDQAAIARILEETKEVAAILADVLDGDDEAEAPSAPAAPVLETKSDLAPIASTLDLKYHGLVAELLTKAEWSIEEARATAKKHRLLPGAVVEAVNSWSEEELGDCLIEEGDSWRINAQLRERVRA